MGKKRPVQGEGGGRNGPSSAAKAAAAISARQKKSKFRLKLQHYGAILVALLSVGASVYLSSNRSERDQGAVPDRVRASKQQHQQSRLTVQSVMARAQKAKCKDRANSATCAQYVVHAGCDSAPGWMAVMCAASCDRCHLLDPKVRCDPKRLNISAEPAFKAGGMNRMFEALQDKFPQYNVRYLKRPPDGPWVVSFDNFLSDQEIQTIVEQSGELKRSVDQVS